MKNLFTFTFLVLVVIACTQKGSNLNAGAVALGQSAISYFETNNDKDYEGWDIRTTKDLNEIDTSLQISNYVRHIFQENSQKSPDGVLWFATYGKGAGRYGPSFTGCSRKSMFEFYSRNNGLAGNEIRDIKADQKGNIWFATNEGVSRYDAWNLNENKFTNFTMKEGLISNNVWTILEDRDGIIWFGTDNGVCRFNPSREFESSEKAFTSFPLPSADLTNFLSAYPAPKLVNKIFQDNNGIIWLGTNGNGIFYFDPSKTSAKTNQPVLTQITEKDGLCNNFIHGIYQDTKGYIWFSSRFGGVSRFIPDVSVMAGGQSDNADQFAFTNLTMKNGLSSNFVWTVMEDLEGNFWFGTAGGGVDYLNHSALNNIMNKSSCGGKSNFTNYKTVNGLASDYVQSIMQDNKGNIWFGTGGGVSRFIPNSGPKASWVLFTSYPSRDDC